jgi:hypothetical protein
VHLSSVFQPAGVVRVISRSAEPSRGSIDPAGTNYFPVTAAVSFTATPKDGFVFDRFLVNGTTEVRKNPLTLSVTSETTVDAFFRVRTFTEEFNDLSGFDRSAGWTTTVITRTNNNQVVQASVAKTTIEHIPNAVASLVKTAELLPGLGSFELRVNTETNYDRLEFYINDELQQSWSGTIDWSLYIFEITPAVSATAPTKLEWRYVKDNVIDAPVDAVFIDNLDLPLGQLPPVAPQMQITLAGQVRQIAISAQPGRAVSLEYSNDLGSWIPLATLTANSAGNAFYSDSSSDAHRFYRSRAL